jgi:hypothetical protein
MGPQGVKAKYVRIELRKIETLPGGPQNSFYDFVGQSPINLWQSPDEFSMLHSVSLPCPPFLPLLLVPDIEYSKMFLSTFEYRNPFHRLSRSRMEVRSITRSLGASPDVLLSQAGIKYELVGQVCVQGKAYVFPFLSITPVYSILSPKWFLPP